MSYWHDPYKFSYGDRNLGFLYSLDGHDICFKTTRGKLEFITFQTKNYYMLNLLRGNRYKYET